MIFPPSSGTFCSPDFVTWQYHRCFVFASSSAFPRDTVSVCRNHLSHSLDSDMIGATEDQDVVFFSCSLYSSVNVCLVSMSRVHLD